MFPRFRLHRVLEASQDCGVFLLLFFGKKDLSVLWYTKVVTFRSDKIE